MSDKSPPVKSATTRARVRRLAYTLGGWDFALLVAGFPKGRIRP